MRGAASAGVDLPSRAGVADERGSAVPGSCTGMAAGADGRGLVTDWPTPAAGALVSRIAGAGLVGDGDGGFSAACSFFTGSAVELVAAASFVSATMAGPAGALVTTAGGGLVGASAAPTREATSAAAKPSAAASVVDLKTENRMGVIFLWASGRGR